mgnify:FL=1
MFFTWLLLGSCAAGVYTFTLLDVYKNNYNKIRRYGPYWDICLTLVLPMILTGSTVLTGSSFVGGFIFSVYRRKVLNKRGLTKKQKSKPIKKKAKTRKQRALDEYYGK